MNTENKSSKETIIRVLKVTLKVLLYFVAIIGLLVAGCFTMVSFF